MTKREIRPAMPPATAVTVGGVVRRCAAGSSVVIVWRSLLGKEHQAECLPEIWQTCGCAGYFLGLALDIYP